MDTMSDEDHKATDREFAFLSTALGYLGAEPLHVRQRVLRYLNDWSHDPNNTPQKILERATSAIPSPTNNSPMAEAQQSSTPSGPTQESTQE